MAIDANGVKVEDRPLDQLREEAIDQLIMNYSHGVISAEAFERRLDIASDAKSHQELIDVVADLTLQPDQQYRQHRERNFSPRFQAGNDTRNEKVLCILSSNQLSGQWLVPAEIHVTNVFGSVELDFSEAIFQHQHITIQVKNWVGSLTVLVSEQMNVVSNMFNVVGSSSNQTTSTRERQAPQIVIEGYSILGSLDVKIKRTMKETFRHFANQVREVLSLDK